MKHGSLFSGIGGFDLAAEWAGWENMFHCEWNPFGQKVLKHYWPNAATYEDITKTDFTIWRGRIDILTGGFPCQPYSAAGKRLGKEDERHLWPEMRRVIREVQPRWVVGENVLGLVNWNGGLVFEEVQADLEAEGYEVQPFILPAASVGNCPHKRDRVWFVAYSDHKGRSCGPGQIQETNGEIPKRDNDAEPCNTGNRVAENTLCSGRLYGEPEQEGAEIREQRNACSGDSIGVCGAKVAGVTPDTDNVRLQQCKTPGTLGEGQKEICGEGHKPSMRTETNECFGVAPDTASEGRKEWEQDNRQTHSEENRPRLDDRPERYGNFRNAPDTTSCGRGQIGGQRESRFLNETGEIGNWENFPTQSPLCSRTNGISTELHGITFSKWRNESIKAAGNAICPQVVFQIFKAINEYREKYP